MYTDFSLNIQIEDKYILISHMIFILKKKKRFSINEQFDEIIDKHIFIFVTHNDIYAAPYLKSIQQYHTLVVKTVLIHGRRKRGAGGIAPPPIFCQPKKLGV